ncbi:Uncharacterized protein APZ42_029142 [Daphnia magna]|uniref:Uncharacterized protein n=1 Tax=Daphnia magna TaxID=35525 RepID=A0A164PWC4_9CRUS|nr:Uncharacterized protein APZ42_029142 [Daphnia magna]
MGAKIKESVMTPFKGSSITKAKGDGGGEKIPGADDYF